MLEIGIAEHFPELKSKSKLQFSDVRQVEKNLNYHLQKPFWLSSENLRDAQKNVIELKNNSSSKDLFEVLPVMDFH